MQHYLLRNYTLSEKTAEILLCALKFLRVHRKEREEQNRKGKHKTVYMFISS